jgi:hypothetical protein
MSQKSSVPQAVSFVSQVLKRDTALEKCESDDSPTPEFVLNLKYSVARRERTAPIRKTVNGRDNITEE